MATQTSESDTESDTESASDQEADTDTAEAEDSTDSENSAESEQASESSDSSASSDSGNEHSEDSEDSGDGKPRLDRTDESQHFVDQSVMDFDPDDGLYSGTVVTGETEIDGPHIGDDGTVDEKEAEQFLEDGKKQAREEGLLDEDDKPTEKGADSKGSGDTGETGDEGTEKRE